MQKYKESENNGLTVIIPTYIPKDYLWDCLDSIEKQSLDKDKFQVIIVLNGEKEPYWSKIEEHLKSYTFNSTLLYSKAKGVSQARNIGIEAVKSRYITFIDDDDWISSCYLEEMLAQAENDAIVETYAKSVDEHKKEEKEHFLGIAFKNSQKYKKHNILNSRSFFSSSCCKLIDINSIGKERFVEGITHGEDAFFMYKISYRIKKIKTTSEKAIYYVRERQDSASRNTQIRNKKKKMERKMLYLYSSTYFSHPFRYNFLFTMTRIMATLRKLLLE